ncbi:MAG: DUF2007 domain-containing protein [Pseudomonadota bacterium]
MKFVYSAGSLVDARLLLDQLTSCGIEAELQNENQIGGLGELPVTYPEVWVLRDGDESRARQIVERFERQTEGEPVVCTTCGEPNPSTFEICWQCNQLLDSARLI